MNIYLHPSGVKKELKNDYIGEYVEETINIVYNQIHRIHKD
jgi:hypothetical protein